MVPVVGAVAAAVHTGKEAELDVIADWRRDRARLHLPIRIAELLLAFIFVCSFLMELHEASGLPEMVIQRIIRTCFYLEGNL